MTYPSRKEFGGHLMLVFAVLFIVIPFLLPGPKPAILILMAITYPFAAIFVWVYFHTVYTVDNGNLIVRCGPIRKKIPISTIRQIRRNALAISGIKLGLSFRMLDITYANSAVYISPSNEPEFLEELKSINPNITIETETT